RLDLVLKIARGVDRQAVVVDQLHLAPKRKIRARQQFVELVVQLLNLQIGHVVDAQNRFFGLRRVGPVTGRQRQDGGQQDNGRDVIWIELAHGANSPRWTYPFLQS